MSNFKSKKIGFLGTVLFHVFLFLICFFSYVGYTSSVPLEGIEITYLIIEEKEIDEIIDSELKDQQINEIDKNEEIEQVLTEDSDLVNMAVDEDSISINKLEEIEEAPSISSELETIFSKLNQLNSSNDSVESLDENVDPQIYTDNIIVDDLRDGYILSENRFAIRKIKPNYSCKESGRVVVRVWVDRDGFTIKAEAGIRGTTESAPCLLEEAKSAALQTTWTPDPNGPPEQYGKITYNFYRN